MKFSVVSKILSIKDCSDDNTRIYYYLNDIQFIKYIKIFLMNIIFYYGNPKLIWYGCKRKLSYFL